MNVGQSFLAEFDQEMQSTRKTLERLPDEKWNWKPHEKSGTTGWLAGHLAMFPDWLSTVMKKEEFDYAPVGGPSYQPPSMENRTQTLAVFDRGVGEARAALAAADEQAFSKEWTLLAGGERIFTMPRAACIRSTVLNHMIHHRGQLTVYLRLLGVAVPGLYGPSADEAQPEAARATASS